MMARKGRKENLDKSLSFRKHLFPGEERKGSKKGHTNLDDDEGNDR